MKTAALFARVGNFIISVLASILIMLLFLYGGYSLWDTAMVYQDSFVDKELLQYKPSGNDAGNQPTLDELRKVNPDVCGWGTIEDTHIDYPIVQGDTDLEYINKDINGEFSFSGSIFLSSQNRPDFSDPYNILYGHHIANGGMFGDVVEFREPVYFEKHKSGSLHTLDKSYEIHIFACVEADAYDYMIYETNMDKSGGMKDVLSYIKEHAVQYRDIGVTAKDSIVALSTCAEAKTNGRVVLFGQLKEKSLLGEEVIQNDS